MIIILLNNAYKIYSIMTSKAWEEKDPFFYLLNQISEISFKKQTRINFLLVLKLTFKLYYLAFFKINFNLILDYFYSKFVIHNNI